MQIYSSLSTDGTLPTLVRIISLSDFSKLLTNSIHLASGNNSGYVDNAQAVLANLPLSMDPVLCNSVFLDHNGKVKSIIFVIATVTSQSGYLARRHLGDNFSQKVRLRSNCFITTVDSRFLMACGFWDNSFRVFSTDTGRSKLLLLQFHSLITHSC